MATFAQSVDNHGLDAALLERLLPAGHLRVFGAGETVFAQQSPRTWFGVVMAGRVELLEGHHGDPRPVATIEAGAMISEGFLLGEERPHHLTARATEPTEVLILDAEAKEAFRRHQPDAWEGLILRVAQRLRERLKAVDLHKAGHTRDLRFTTTRTETDSLGTREVPASAYYGVHTVRALEAFTISGRPLHDYGHFIDALVHVKKAAALTNAELRVLEQPRADAIVAACDEVLGGSLREQFVVDMISGGAGMAVNMCTNEIIANRALEIMGHERGQHHLLHPLDHVNRSQSTNDVYPTAVKLALLLMMQETLSSLDRLIDALMTKEREFGDVLKLGRTENQDAIPMTLGQEFGAWEGMVRSARRALAKSAEELCVLNIGATAVGTGLNSPPAYASRVTQILRRQTSLPLVLASDLVEATQDTGAFVAFSGVLKRAGVALSKISNDLRWLSSGPRAGLGEIHLPRVQHGATMIPGKVNPVIPEMVNQVCYQLCGFDTAITMAAESTELELAMAQPLIAYDLLQGLALLTNATETLTTRCVEGISANKEVCAAYVRNSIGLVTALVPVLGSDRAARVAKEALATGRSVYDLVTEKGWLTRERVAELLDPKAMTSPFMADPEPLGDTMELPRIETGDPQ